MLNLTTLHDLFRHMEWADSRVWQSVLADPRIAAAAKRDHEAPRLKRSRQLDWRNREGRVRIVV